MLFDHFVGASEQRRRDGKAEYLGGGEVDNEIELGRLLDRQIAGFGPTQNLIDIVGGAAKKAWEIWSIGHQPARHYVFGKAMHGGHAHAQWVKSGH